MNDNKLFCRDCKHCGAIPDFDGDWQVRICNLKGRNVQSDSPMTCEDFTPKPPKKQIVIKENKNFIPPTLAVSPEDIATTIQFSCIDWEQRRYELVKSLACAYFSNEGAARSGAIEFIINIAEEIIEKLKSYEKDTKK